jgi:hypothetical protein
MGDGKLVPPTRGIRRRTRATVATVPSTRAEVVSRVYLRPPSFQRDGDAWVEVQPEMSPETRAVLVHLVADALVASHEREHPR